MATSKVLGKRKVGDGRKIWWEHVELFSGHISLDGMSKFATSGQYVESLEESSHWKLLSECDNRNTSIMPKVKRKGEKEING